MNCLALSDLLPFLAPLRSFIEPVGTTPNRYFAFVCAFHSKE
jgi:hypothetical protein